MSEHVIDGNPPIPFRLRESARARRISLRVSGIDGKVTLTVPRGVSQREALQFALSKETWLRNQIGRQPEHVRVGIGVQLPMQGALVTINAATGRRVTREGDSLLVPGPSERTGARVQAYLKETARQRLGAASDYYASLLGKQHTKLTLRDTRSRWGSCSSRGALMFSWRLIMAPEEVLDYVAAHEVAHLAEMNHSKKFWDTVEQIHGPYAAPRKWLRSHGGKLHRYRFSD